MSEEKTQKGGGKGGSPDDGAWQNELTEENLPSPAQRDDVAKDQKIDPDPPEGSPPPWKPGA